VTFCKEINPEQKINLELRIAGSVWYLARRLCGGFVWRVRLADENQSVKKVAG